MQLTDTLNFDEDLPLNQQLAAVQRHVAALLREPAEMEETEHCGGELTRPTRQVWYAGQAEIICYYQYVNPPEHPACFALNSRLTILRPKLI